MDPSTSPLALDHCKSVTRWCVNSSSSSANVANSFELNGGPLPESDISGTL